MECSIYLHVWVKSKFFDNSNLITLVDIQRLHGNGKRFLSVSEGGYISFEKSFLAVPYCFIKFFHLQQS